MREAKLGDGSTKYADSRKHNVGEWYKSRTGKWSIITSVEAGVAVDEYGDEAATWFHTMRDATPEELAERERAQAEWDAKTPEERTQARLEKLERLLPALDW